MDLETVPRSVLLVEDDGDLRSSLASILTEAGHVVRNVENGNAAIQELDRALPDVILLDLMMPSGNGWEVLERLRTTPALRDVPVVVVSAYASAPPTGTLALLHKPVGRDALLSAVATYGARSSGGSRSS
jgi:CheY-like chemotaxis protein